MSLEEKLKELWKTPDGKLAIIAIGSLATLLFLLGIPVHHNFHVYLQMTYLVVIIWAFVIGIPVAQHIGASGWIKWASLGVVVLALIFLIGSCSDGTGVEVQATASRITTPTSSLINVGACINGCTVANAPSTFQECTGELHTYKLNDTASKEIMKPNACKVEWEVESGKVLLLNEDDKVLGMVDETGGNLNYSFRKGRSVGGHATFDYKLVPR